MEPDRRVGDFAFAIELRDGRPNCVPAEDRDFALATALTSAWGEDGTELADMLEQRCGYDREGAVGFTYDGDGPDEAPDGKVRVYFMKEVRIFEQAFFEAAAVGFGLAALAALRRAARPASEAVEKRLRALRARSRP